MLYDPTFLTWRSFGVTTNSQMKLITPELDASSDLLFGFGDSQQAAIVDALPAFAPK